MLAVVLAIVPFLITSRETGTGMAETKTLLVEERATSRSARAPRGIFVVMVMMMRGVEWKEEGMNVDESSVCGRRERN